MQKNMKVGLTSTFQVCIVHFLQSGASSQAKHGGAYFSAVYGSIEDPLAAPGPYENLGPPFLGGSAQPVTFVLPLTHTQLPLINGHSSRICSEAGLMYLFGDKYIRPVPEQILLQCPLRSGSSVCMCEHTVPKPNPTQTFRN